MIAPPGVVTPARTAAGAVAVTAAQVTAAQAAAAAAAAPGLAKVASLMDVKVVPTGALAQVCRIMTRELL